MVQVFGQRFNLLSPLHRLQLKLVDRLSLRRCYQSSHICLLLWDRQFAVVDYQFVLRCLMTRVIN